MTENKIKKLKLKETQRILIWICYCVYKRHSRIIFFTINILLKTMYI